MGNEELNLRFRNGRFKIMQIADVQELPVPSPDTARLIEMAVAAEQPDLIVFTGDQIYGIHPLLWGKQPEKKIESIFAYILRPVIAASVPFAVTYGNHDAECGVSNAAQAQLYERFRGYTPGERRSAADAGTFRLPVYGEYGSVIFSLYAFDTHGSAAAGGGKGVTRAQLDWFAAMREKERTEQNRTIPSLIFQHIPVPEYYNVLKKVNKSTRGAVEAFGAHKNEFYVLPEELQKTGGFLREAPAVSGAGDEEFGMLRKDGAVLAVSVGHDHNNSFAADYNDMKLIYTQGAGFHVYGPHLKRGVRVFTLNEADPARFTTYTRTWESLTNERPKEFLLELGLSLTPSSVDQGKALLRRWAPAAAAGAAIAGGILWFFMKSNK